MISIVLNTKPISKDRHRSRIVSGKIITYDPKSTEKAQSKWDAASQMRKNGSKTIQDGPIAMTMTAYTSMPKSWSQARINKSEGLPCKTRPDLDNYEKFYCDVLNGIAYHDDAQITNCLSQKVYSSHPRVEITLVPIGDSMVNEHAITVKDKFTLDDVVYLVKKANRLGLQQRQIFRVYSQDDTEGHHVYFETESLIPKAGK